VELGGGSVRHTGVCLGEDFIAHAHNTSADSGGRS
jgi:hypothetical protein